MVDQCRSEKIRSKRYGRYGKAELAIFLKWLGRKRKKLMEWETIKRRVESGCGDKKRKRMVCR
jgi:hypothetical protein